MGYYGYYGAGGAVSALSVVGLCEFLNRFRTWMMTMEVVDDDGGVKTEGSVTNMVWIFDRYAIHW